MNLRTLTILALLAFSLAACGGGGGGGGTNNDSLVPGRPESVGALYDPPGEPGKVLLTWTPGPGPAATGFVVYRLARPENVWRSVAELDDTLTEFLDEGPFGYGPAYAYRVVAVNEAGSSSPGDTAAFTPRPLTRGALYIWGRNDTGQVGVGSNLDDYWPRSPAVQNVAKVDAGDGFTLALSLPGAGTQLLAFGDDSRGQLGDGPPMADSNVPVLVTDPATGFGVTHFVTAIAAGGRHALAITNSGTGIRKLWAWGANNFGQVGDGSLTDRPSPVDLMPMFASEQPVNFIGVAAGEDFSLALADDGRLYSWGNNSWGQLGQGATASPPAIGSSSSIPVRIIFPGGFVGRVEQIAAGGAHALLVEKLGTGATRVWSFGDDRDGQLGDPGATLLFKDRPVLVDGSTGLGSVTQVAAGDSHSLVLDVNGDVWTFGAWYTNPPGTNSRYPLPFRLTAPANVAWIACGGRFSMVHQQTGSVYGWGDNGSGQLNFDPSDDSPGAVLEQILVLPGFAAFGAVLAAGGDHSIAFVP